MVVRSYETATPRLALSFEIGSVEFVDGRGGQSRADRVEREAFRLPIGESVGSGRDRRDKPV